MNNEERVLNGRIKSNDSRLIKVKLNKMSSTWYKKHKKTWQMIPSQEKMQLSQGIRDRSINEGMLMESMTVDEWLNHVEELNGGK